MSLLYDAVEIIACLLSYIYSLYVLGIFFPKSVSYRIWIIIVFGILYLPLTATTYKDIPNALMSVLCMLLVYGVSLICYQGNPAQKLLVTVIYNTFSILYGNILFAVISSIAGIPISDLMSGSNSARVYTICTSYFIEFIIIYLLRGIRMSSQHLNKTEALISFVFFLCDFMVCVLTHYVLFYMTDGGKLLNICFVLSGLMLAATLLVLYLLRQLQMQHQRDTENKMLSLQISEQKQLFDQMQMSIETVQSVRHDMKNFLLQYKLLLDEGNVQEVQKDLEKMLGERLLPAYASYTKNPLLNALLKYKSDIAQKHHIPFRVRIILNQDYQNLELMVALSNLIDNAIEAELKIPEQYRGISVEVIQNENKISILIKNKITSSVLIPNPKLTTTKEKDGVHGIGLKNVKRIVASQEGLIDFFEENGNFCVHIFYS